MNKLLIIADRQNWCYDRRAKAIQKHAPENWAVEIDYYESRRSYDFAYAAYDLVLLLAPNIARDVCQLFTLARIRTPLVVAYNSGIGRKGYSLQEALCAADYVIVNNYAAWLAGGFGVRHYNACNISNGVDCETFRPTIPWRERPPKALWIGSDSKADDADDVKGWQRVLKHLGIIFSNNKGYGLEPDFRIAEPGNGMDEDAMRDWYNSGQVLFVASSSEGTPNIALEAAACGTTIVTTRVGNMPELIRHRQNGFFVNARAGIRAGLVEFLDEIESENRKLWEIAADRMLPIIREWDWSIRSQWYFGLFDAILNRSAANVRPFSYMDTRPHEIGR